MAKKARVDLAELNRSFADRLHQAATRPNLWGYVPHAKQIQFHSSPAPTRLYVGGNRSGKTVGGCVEDIYWLRGEHPYRKVPEPPVRGRIIGVDFDQGVEKILKPEISRWCPPSLLKNGSWEDSYVKSTRTLECANGSFLEFMSYVQDVDKFAGTSRHFIHYDEEPPKAIYAENKLRLLDTGGHEWFTMTPVSGMTWIYDDIFLPGVTGASKYIGVIIVDVTENPHISPDEIERILEGLDEDEKRARKSGEFIQMGGLVFKNFSLRHIIPPVDPRTLWDWEWTASLDHGFNNPTAWLWHAVAPKGIDGVPPGKVITFFEHYMSEWTVEQHAARVHEINKELGRGPWLYVGDPSINQRNAVTGHSIQVSYVQHNIPIALANNNVGAGIDRMNQYLNAEPEPMWQITENCPNLIREMRRLRWKTRTSAKLRDQHNPFEEIHKKDDHAPDSARYFFTFMPEIKAQEAENKELSVAELRKKVDEFLNVHHPVDPSNRRDEAFVSRGESQESTAWSVAYEDNVGEF